MKHTFSILIVIIIAIFSTNISSGFTFLWEDKDKLLLDAIKKQQLGKFKNLLQDGADANMIYGKGSHDWVMCLATERRNIDFLKLAVQYGGAINLRNRIKPVQTISSAPILCAISNHNMIAFDYLLEQGVDLSIHTFEDAKPIPNDSSVNPILLGKTLYGSPLTRTLAPNEYCMTLKIMRKKELTWEEKLSLKRSVAVSNVDHQSKKDMCRREVIKILRQQGHNIDQERTKKDRKKIKEEFKKKKAELEIKLQSEERIRRSLE